MRMWMRRGRGVGADQTHRHSSRDIPASLVCIHSLGRTALEPLLICCHCVPCAIHTATPHFIPFATSSSTTRLSARNSAMATNGAAAASPTDASATAPEAAPAAVSAFSFDSGAPFVFGDASAAASAAVPLFTIGSPARADAGDASSASESRNPFAAEVQSSRRARDRNEAHRDGDTADPKDGDEHEEGEDEEGGEEGEDEEGEDEEGEDEDDEEEEDLRDSDDEGDTRRCFFFLQQHAHPLRRLLHGLRVHS